MPTVVLDDPKMQAALREAQRHPVKVEDNSGVHAFIVSEELMALVRGKLQEQLRENTGAIRDEVAKSDFTEDDLKAILLDDVGE